MNQLALSNDINVITAEINSYKQIAGQSIFEIGKRLKHVKENDLVHGQFGTWVKERIDLTPSQASNFIAAYEQFGELPTSAILNTSVIFEMLSLPESIDRQDFITESHTISSTGETKTVDEMTVKELREVKRALQTTVHAKEEAEAQARKLEHKYTLAVNQHSDQQDKLLAQIELLQQSKAKDSPETLKHIASLQLQVSTTKRLESENTLLQQKVSDMQQAFDTQLAKAEQDKHSIRKMREAFKNILIALNLEQSIALGSYLAVKGNKDAQVSIGIFLQNIEKELYRIIDEWNQFLEIPKSEVNVKDAILVTERTRNIAEVGEGAETRDS